MLELKNLNLTFNANTPNAKQVFKNLNLKVSPGDFVSIIGSNGSGKSTLLNCISGNIEVDSGQIILEQKHLEFTKEYQRAKLIGHLFQDPLMGTAPDMSILENLELAYIRGKKQSNIFKRFFKIGLNAQEKDFIFSKLSTLQLDLEKRLTNKVGLLSGGQRQALTLMMATINTPKLLLLDEHTAALDPKSAQKIMSLTNQIIQEHKITTIMITHNIQQALDYGNRLILMHNGQIIQDFDQISKKQLTVEQVLKLYNLQQNQDNLVQSLE